MEVTHVQTHTDTSEFSIIDNSKKFTRLYHLTLVKGKINDYIFVTLNDCSFDHCKNIDSFVIGEQKAPIDKFLTILMPTNEQPRVDVEFDGEAFQLDFGPISINFKVKDNSTLKISSAEDKNSIEAIHFGNVYSKTKIDSLKMKNALDQIIERHIGRFQFKTIRTSPDFLKDGRSAFHVRGLVSSHQRIEQTSYFGGNRGFYILRSSHPFPFSEPYSLEVTQLNLTLKKHFDCFQSFVSFATGRVCD